MAIRVTNKRKPTHGRISVAVNLCCAMALRAEIDRAFAHRSKPSSLIEKRSPITPEQQDARWFAGRDWRDVRWQDWHEHPDAFYAFVPQAFVYYLPSILLGTMDAPSGQLQVGDALLGILDRSPEAYNWDAFITNRLLGLAPDEYEVLKSWILSQSGLPHVVDEDRLTRAYETTDLLARETTRVRNLLKPNSVSDL